MVSKSLTCLAFGFVLSLLVPAAGMASSKAVKMAPHTSAARLQGRHYTLAPMAYIMFCKKYPGECAAKGQTASQHFGDFRQLDAVNRQINHTIAPRLETRDADSWVVSPAAGDCDDYAVSKRARLIADGWSPNNVRLAVAITSAGEGHAVVVASTDNGDYVLDNRTDRIVPWNRTDLQFLKIQDRDRPNLWRAL